jgi:hypothetical protein
MCEHPARSSAHAVDGLAVPGIAETPATETKASDSEHAGKGATQSGVGEDPDDPSNLLSGIRERRVCSLRNQRFSDPLGPLAGSFLGDW